MSDLVYQPPVSSEEMSEFAKRVVLLLAFGALKVLSNGILT